MSFVLRLERQPTPRSSCPDRSDLPSIVLTSSRFCFVTASPPEDLEVVLLSAKTCDAFTSFGKQLPRTTPENMTMCRAAIIAHRWRTRRNLRRQIAHVAISFMKRSSCQGFVGAYFDSRAGEIHHRSRAVSVNAVRSHHSAARILGPITTRSGFMKRRPRACFSIRDCSHAERCVVRAHHLANFWRCRPARALLTMNL